MSNKEKAQKWLGYYRAVCKELEEAERMNSLYNTEETNKRVKKAKTKKKVYWLIYRDMYDKAYYIG